MANFVYNIAPQLIGDNIGWVGATTINAMLVNSTSEALTAPTTNRDRDNMTGWTTGEISGTGYVAGGKAIANRLTRVDDTNDRVELDSSDDTLVWTGLNAGTFNGIIVYRSNGGGANDTPLAFIDIGTLASNGGDVTITWDAEGIVQARCV
jgi:hypothetical protein